MLKKVLCTLGFGGATVDTVVQEPKAEIGEKLGLEVRIKGGEAEQAIRAIILELVTSCRVEIQENATERAEIVIASTTIELGRVEAREEKTIPTELDVPVWAPITGYSTRTVLRTRLEVIGGVDPQDTDAIEILPNRVMAATLNGIRDAGFVLADTEVEHDPQSPRPTVQEFDFRPTSPGMYSIEQVEVWFSPVEGGLDVHLITDRCGAFGARGRERSAQFRVLESEIDNLPNAFRAAIAAARPE